MLDREGGSERGNKKTATRSYPGHPRDTLITRRARVTRSAIHVTWVPTTPAWRYIADGEDRPPSRSLSLFPPRSAIRRRGHPARSP